MLSRDKTRCLGETGLNDCERRAQCARYMDRLAGGQRGDPGYVSMMADLRESDLKTCNYFIQYERRSGDVKQQGKGVTEPATGRPQ